MLCRACRSIRFIINLYPVSADFGRSVMPAGARQYRTSKRSTRIRVVQCFTGGVGSECVRRIVKPPDMTLVGVLVHSADKDGKDAGELVGIGPIGISATRDLDQI